MNDRRVKAPRSGPRDGDCRRALDLAPTPFADGFLFNRSVDAETGKPLHRAKDEAPLGSLLACQSLEIGLMLWEMPSMAEALEEER